MVQVLPANSRSPAYVHVLQNILLIYAAVVLAPYLAFLALASQAIVPFLKAAKHIKQHRQWRVSSSSTFRPRTILISGIGTTKGLALARDFYRAGHRVIGADYEAYGIPVLGHYSVAIERFRRLPKYDNIIEHTKALIGIILADRVELWIDCQESISAVEAAEVAEIVQKETKCKAVQFSTAVTAVLQDKDSFVENARQLNLNVQEAIVVTSVTEALAHLSPKRGNKQYSMKGVGANELSQTILPLATTKETDEFVRRLKPSPFRPFILQEYVSGIEYCAHSLVLKGRVEAFVACPQGKQIMNWTALPSSTALSKAMLSFTQTYAKSIPDESGHLTMDFVVDAAVAEKAETAIGVREQEIKDLMREMYPVQCRSTPHESILLLSSEAEAEDLAETYLSMLPDHEPRGIASGHRSQKMVVPQPGLPGYYWIGHDLITLVLLPLVGMISFEVSPADMLTLWMRFLEHVIYWKDSTCELWDPWPAWTYYFIFLPMKFLDSLLERRWWSFCDISTGKMERC
ncbi:hypothetical protein PVAG01_08301 [Phlyctema vagabunda]|uniref:NAD(P)-binding protein n=1 Tax=Phlyctema vagabunda TaxID=108571 RepID=A0ABR4P907_9HELO